MRRVVAAFVMMTVLIAGSVPAWAGSATEIALGLASFAVFTQIVGALFAPRAYSRRDVVYTDVVAQPPVIVYAAPPPVIVASAPVIARATEPTVIQYPHGRYELRWSGQQYVWTWIPARREPR